MQCMFVCHPFGQLLIVLNARGNPLVIAVHPHTLNCRLLLWDCDDRAYGYYIEVSTDQRKWHCVADKTMEACRYSS